MHDFFKNRLKKKLFIYFSKKILQIILFLIFFAIEGFTQNINCSVCGRAIHANQKYLTAGGKVFCSEACWQTTLPKCVICGRRSLNGFRDSEGKFYCSQNCLSKTWRKCSLCGKPSPDGIIAEGLTGEFYCAECAKNPRCFCCGLPAKCLVLEDGRNVCQNCLKTAIVDEQSLVRIMEQVRSKLKTKLGLYTENQIRYRLVDRPTLKKITGMDSELELGAYKFEERIERTIAKKTDLLGRNNSKEIIEEKKTSSHKIFVLSHLSKDKAIEVCAHELAHDWMQAHCSQIQDIKIKEGWAEYVAWLINQSYGNDKLNKRIEQNEDPIYGGGFRMIRAIADKKGFQGLVEYLRTMN